MSPTLKVEIAFSSFTSVNFCRTARRHTPKYANIHIYSRITSFREITLGAKQILNDNSLTPYVIAQVLPFVAA